MAQTGGATVQSILARYYPRLDPRAVLAVASREGLGGGIGDGGHAFGPFQLNNAGGVLTGRFTNLDPQAINRWAWSPEGIRYALDRINQVAGGLKGRAAVEAIVNRFERPANPGAEISGALGAYGAPTRSVPVAPPAGSSSSRGSLVDALTAAAPSNDAASRRQALLALAASIEPTPAPAPVLSLGQSTLTPAAPDATVKPAPTYLPPPSQVPGTGPKPPPEFLPPPQQVPGMNAGLALQRWLNSRR